MNTPKYVLAILSRLHEGGYPAVLVGGCVRDLLLGRRPNDWDIASAALPGEVMDIFPRTIPTGLAHGTVTVLSSGHACEVTTFRRDGQYSDFRRPDSIEFTGDLEADLARRDFTINAMALNPADGVLTDPFGGRVDLAAGLIRAVGDPGARFREDALRMLRALRFSAQLGFSIEPQTLAAIRNCAPLCAALSPERVRDELFKTLRSPRPEYIGEMIGLGLLDAFVSREGAAQAAEDRSPSDFARLAALPLYARLAHLCYELYRSRLILSVAGFLTALRFDGQALKTASAATHILHSGSRSWKRLLRDYGEAACLAAYPGSRALRKILKSGECWSLAALAVSGRDLIALGYFGPTLGAELDRLLEHVIDFPDENNFDILCKLAKADLEGYNG